MIIHYTSLQYIPIYAQLCQITAFDRLENKILCEFLNSLHSDSSGALNIRPNWSFILLVLQYWYKD